MKNDMVEINKYLTTYFDVDRNKLDDATFRAEDEQHARELFAQFYPGIKIVCVDDLGSAF